MGRFILLGSAVLFVGYTAPTDLKIGWPVLSILLLVWDILAEKKNSTALLAGMTIPTLAWTFTGPWFMAVIQLVLEVLHQIASFKKSIRVSKEGVWTSFPWPTQRSWDQVEFMLLKDGMLTIEYRNGRVLQQPIQKDPSLHEADFNEFCQQQCNP